MKKLAETLREAGVDSTSLRLLFDTAAEKVYHLEVSGSRAVATRDQLRPLVPKTGYWPVLLGDDAALKRLKDRPKHFANKRTPQILKDAATLDAAAWFTERHQEMIERL